MEAQQEISRQASALEVRKRVISHHCHGDRYDGRGM